MKVTKKGYKKFFSQFCAKILMVNSSLKIEIKL